MSHANAFPRTRRAPRSSAAAPSTLSVPASNRVSTRSVGSTRTRTRASTFTSDLHDSFIVAVINNSVKDVGMCAYNLNSYDVELRQFADYNSYAITLATIGVIDPTEIIISAATESANLMQAIRESSHLSNVKVTHVPRHNFNDTNGHFLVNKYTVSPCPNLAAFGPSARYLSLACFSAIVLHVEQTLHTSLVPSTLRIRLCPIHVKMFLDLGALEGLDVVTSTRSAAGIQKEASGDCLLKAIDFTQTRAGKRRLRRDLLEPSTVLEAIVNRQDAVEDLFNSESHYNAVRTALKTFPDLERTILILMNVENNRVRQFANSVNGSPRTHVYDGSEDEDLVDGDDGHDTQEEDDDDIAMHHNDDQTIDDDLHSEHEFNTPPSDILIQSLLNVKAALLIVPKITQVLEEMSSSLLKMISRNLRARQYRHLFTEIMAIIEEKAMPRKDRESKIMEGAFAVKQGRNDRLDMCRKLLNENRADMDEITRLVRDTYRIHKVRLRYHAVRGFYLTAPRVELDRRAFPSDFIHIESSGTQHSFTLPALDEKNLLYSENLKNIWKLTTIELGSLLDVILNPACLMSLHRLCDNMAMLDYVTCFVTYQSLSPIPMVRPRFHASGPLVLKGAHHPLLLRADRSASVPNDTFMCETACVHIITGRNQSGKSTHIRLVGNMVILAHTGCFVPAELMVVPIVKRIATKLCNNQDMMRNASHFSREMRDVAAIQSAVPKVDEDGNLIVSNDASSAGSASSDVTTRTTMAPDDPGNQTTLVLIDELGRATSPVDGFAIAWAIAKDLAEIPTVFTLFTTHFQALTALAVIKPHVQSFYLETLVQRREGQPAGGEGEGEEQRDGEQEDQRRVKFTYKVVNGTFQDRTYGFETARAAGFPEQLVRAAEACADDMPVSVLQSGDEFLGKYFSITEEELHELKKVRKAARYHRRMVAILYSGRSGGEKEAACVDLTRRTFGEESGGGAASGSGGEARGGGGGDGGGS